MHGQRCPCHVSGEFGRWDLSRMAGMITIRIKLANKFED